MTGRRALVVLTVLLASGSAVAQQDPSVNDTDYNTTAPASNESYLDGESQPGDPTVSDSDFDTNAPASDEAYLDESTSGDPTVSDSDFDTSVPAGDESYLDDAEGNGASASAKGAPGPAVVAILAALGATAIVLRRKA